MPCVAVADGNLRGRALVNRQVQRDGAVAAVDIGGGIGGAVGRGRVFHTMPYIGVASGRFLDAEAAVVDSQHENRGVGTAIGIGAIRIENIAVVVCLTHPLVTVASHDIHGVDRTVVHRQVEDADLLQAVVYINIFTALVVALAVPLVTVASNGIRVDCVVDNRYDGVVGDGQVEVDDAVASFGVGKSVGVDAALGIDLVVPNKLSFSLNGDIFGSAMLEVEVDDVVDVVGSIFVDIGTAFGVGLAIQIIGVGIASPVNDRDNSINDSRIGKRHIVDV